MAHANREVALRAGLHLRLECSLVTLEEDAEPDASVQDARGLGLDLDLRDMRDPDVEDPLHGTLARLRVVLHHLGEHAAVGKRQMSGAHGYLVSSPEGMEDLAGVAWTAGGIWRVALGTRGQASAGACAGSCRR